MDWDPSMDVMTGTKPRWAAGAMLALVSLTCVAGMPASDPGTALASSPRRDTPASCGRLSTRGTDIVCSDGTRFQWRGVTGFALLEQIAHGRAQDADGFMRWARATGFNLVRVLAMAEVLFDLSPEEGRRHLDTLFEMAAERGLYVEIVALADTARRGMTPAGLREQVAAVGSAAAGHSNAVVQIANEHYHPTQVPALHDPAALRALAAMLPAQVLYTESAAADDRAVQPQGAFITRHLSRGGTPAQMLERVALLGKLAVETGKPVVNGEPIRGGGAGRAGAPPRGPGVLPRARTADVGRGPGRRHVSLPGRHVRPRSRARAAGLRPGVGAGRGDQCAFNAATSLNVSGPTLKACPNPAT